MAVLRTLIGEALRATRLRQDRTLREVSAAARVSLGYLSEVEPQPSPVPLPVRPQAVPDPVSALPTVPVAVAVREVVAAA